MMKIFLLLISCGWILDNANAQEILTITNDHLDHEYLAKTFATTLIKRLEQKIQSQVRAENSRSDVFFPPELDLPDPIMLPDQTINFDNALLMGRYEYTETNLEGLSTLQDDLVIRLGTPLLMNYTLSLEQLAFRGNYSLDVALNLTRLLELIPDFPIEGGILPLDGSGDYELGVNKFQLNVDMALYTFNGNVDGVRVSLPLSFESLLLYFEKLRMSGEEIEHIIPDIWNLIRGLLKGLVDNLWSQYRPEYEKLLDIVLEEILIGCPILELISGDFSCTGLVPAPGTEPPETTPTPECTDTNHCPFDQYCEFESGFSQCRCRDRLYSVENSLYSSSDSSRSSVECLRIPGATCLLDPSDPYYQSCVEYSTCVGTNSTQGRCKCQAGHVGTERGQCDSDVGESCDEFHSAIPKKCHAGFMLACQQGTCRCASPELIYETGRGCVARLRQPCNLFYDEEFKYRVRCAEGLECVEVEAGRSECQIQKSK